jgi:N-carbamoylputrescine amidase
MDAGQVTIGLIQMSCERDPRHNLEKAGARIEEAAARGAQVVCLQELYRSQYFCQSEENASFDLAEPIPGPSTETLGRLAAARNITIIAPIFERRAAGVYHNSALVLDDRGQIAGHYRKMHIPDDPGYYEKFYFTPGDLDFLAHRTSAANLTIPERSSQTHDLGRASQTPPLPVLAAPAAPLVGVLICWDQWFPEAARLTAMAGAEILFYPTAIGWTPDMPEPLRRKMYSAWETIQRSHAIANGVFVAAVNRVGIEGAVEFWGGSFVSDPFGEVLARASHTDEEILVVACDLNQIEETRRNWPFLRDRRIDAYGDLTRRFRS